VRLSALEGLEVTGCSSVYETEPMDDAVGQGDFYNAAVAVETMLSPQELLAACKQIERELGREPADRRHTPRPIDVDLLILGGLELDQPGLVLPHPGVTARRFVLVPLLELDPELALPDGSRLSAALAALGDEQHVARVGSLQKE
jgi:2-amino-4-hydroxy-6-hydroxymethyldihydropteridine diphosphokinase